MIIIGLLLTFVVGYLLTNLLHHLAPWPEKIGLSYILGLGIQTLFMFFISLLNIPITLITTFILLSTLIIFLLILHKLLAIRITIFGKLPGNFTKAENILITSLLAVSIYSLLSSLYWPVNTWDALALYDFRAKIIVSTGFFAQVLSNFTYFSQYPLLTSLANAWVYFLGYPSPHIIYSLYYISLLLLFYSNLKIYTSRLRSLLFTFLLSITPIFLEHSQIAYTNLPYSVYFVAGTIYLYRALISHTSSVRLFILSALTLGLSTWVRSNEQFWLPLAVILVIYSLFKKMFFLIPIYLIILLGIQKPWEILDTGYQGLSQSTSAAIITSLSTTITKLDFNRIISTSGFILVNMLDSWFPVWIIFVISIIYNFPRLRIQKETVFLLLIMSLVCALVYGAYVFSFSIPYWDNIPDSARRMSMFFLPLMIYYIGIEQAYHSHSSA